MITKRELEQAIDEIEGKKSNTFEDCQKLATFYTVYNQLYGEPAQPKTVPLEQEIVHAIGESEFIKSINGKQAKELWKLVDELVEAVKVLSPNLYYSVLRKVKEI